MVLPGSDGDVGLTADVHDFPHGRLSHRGRAL